MTISLAAISKSYDNMRKRIDLKCSKK